MTAPLITCPCCGEAFDVLAVQQGRDVAEFEAMLRQFGESRGLALDYINLFRATPQSAQRLSTRAKLAGELLKLWRTGEFSHEGRAWEVSRSQINEALAEVIRVKGAAAGFKNHNYLKTVLRQAAGKQEAKAEGATERQRRNPNQRPAARPEQMSGEDRPIGEGPLEDVAAAFGDLCRSPRRMDYMPDITNMLRQRLLREGVDLEAFGSLARELKKEGPHMTPAEGLRLLEGSRRAPAQPTPAGECLPGIGG